MSPRLLALRAAVVLAAAMTLSRAVMGDEVHPRASEARGGTARPGPAAAPAPAAAPRPAGAPVYAPRAPVYAPRPSSNGYPGGNAPRPTYDGRGQVLDSRYNHGRYYPPPGTVARSLPTGYRPYYRGGQPYYFSGGVWYAPRAGGFIVVTPPVGIVVSSLPYDCSTLWIGGVPYYYADNVYYTWQPDQNGYAVVSPPDTGDASQQPADGGDAPPPAMPGSPGAQDAQPSDLIIYPKNGQSKDQQAADQYECNNWAKSQTGFDPTQPDGGVAADNADRLHSNYDRAMAACLQGRDYQVN